MLLLNGQLLSENDARISPLADGFMLGAGVFTTLRVRDGRAEFFSEHAARLLDDAHALGLAPGAAENLRARVTTCIAENSLAERDVGLKIIWFADTDGRTGELIMPRPHRYDATTHARGFRLKTVLCATRKGRTLASRKTLNYLEHAIAKRAAHAAGFDEALWIDERERVLEGATTNLFALINGELLTPPTTLGLLPGVIRGVLGRLPLPWRVRETELTRRDLLGAQEIILTNSLLGAIRVSALDERSFPREPAGVADTLSRALHEAARASD
jgi:branched-subunit amino acid aminotransferase/4-amino-4-deoxychorismate lyase